MSASPTLPPRAGDDDQDEHAGRRPVGAEDPYRQFRRAVASAQLRNWLPAEPSRILDISRNEPDGAPHEVCRQLAAVGHQVVRALAPEPGTGPPTGAGGHLALPSSVTPVVGDVRFLNWFRAGAFDAVVAEGSVLSACLAAETTMAQAARLLRPRGRMLLSVDSLLHGLAQLAEQRRWPELADAPAADVVLVPAGPDSWVRCFGADELRALVDDAGFDVEWVRPRTVLPPEVVRLALTRAGRRCDEGSPVAAAAELDQLVASELRLAVERQGESSGTRLTLSAVRRDH